MITILKKKYLGVTVLLLVLTLLLISTLLILFAGQYSGLQQKISANFYRNQQALEAARAGIEAAVPYYRTNYAAIVAAASGGYLTPYMNSSTQNVTLANGSKYTFVFSNPTASNYTLIRITSTGVNADGSSTRVLTQLIKSSATSITAPTVSFTSQGNITLKNSASINNTQTNSNIISGGTITFQNSAQTTTSAGVGSNSSGLGSDVQQNNAALAAMSTDAFFQSVFGATQSAVQSAASYTYTNSEDASYNSLNGVTGAVVWINQTSHTANISGSTTIGSPTQPVILIVSGNLKIANSVTIYGLIFIMNSTSTDFNVNSVTINGAIAATGNFQFSNSATLNYNSSVLNALPSVGSGSTNYAKVAASWKDF